MSNVLCIYYSRSGKTKKAMEEIAQALDAELVSCMTMWSGAAWWAGCAAAWIP